MQIIAPPTARPAPSPQGARRGLAIVHTGNGKGKRRSTAAFAVLRAHGRGQAVCIDRFMMVSAARSQRPMACDGAATVTAIPVGSAWPPAGYPRNQPAAGPRLACALLRASGGPSDLPASGGPERQRAGFLPGLPPRAA
jgi:hypothetical protein